MGQATFAFYNEHLQELGRTATGSQGGGYCSGVASVTGQQTTTTISGGLWRWGDGVVTDPSKPEGEWAELAEWIEFDLQAGLFFWRRDKKELQDYCNNRTNLNTAEINPGSYLSHYKLNDRMFVAIPRLIASRLFTPIIKSEVNKSNFVTRQHLLLLKIYRYYNSKMLTHIDHMNGDSLCNFPANLRPVTAQQNKINSAKPWAFPGVSWHKKDKSWRGKLFHISKRFLEELDAASFRRILLQEKIDSGHLEKHDLWAFDKRVEATLAYRQDNNVDAFNRPIQAYASPTAPIDPSTAVTYSLPPIEPIRPRFNTLWYRPSIPAV